MLLIPQDRELVIVTEPELMPQFPLQIPPGSRVPKATGFERFTAFLTLYFLHLSLIALTLLRAWFLALFKVAFPFMPECLEEDRHD